MHSCGAAAVAGSPEINGPAFGLDLLTNLHVVDGVFTKGLLDALDDQPVVS
jgi:hypothetical protein